MQGWAIELFINQYEVQDISLKPDQYIYNPSVRTKINSNVVVIGIDLNISTSVTASASRYG